MSLLTDLVESIVDMPGAFFDIITMGGIFHTIITGILIGLGALMVGLASAVFGGLTIGALVDLITPGSSGATHPEGR